MTEIVHEQPTGESKPTLDELFARDPLELTASDLTTIVSTLRQQRVRWEAGDAAPKVKKEKTPALPIDPNLSLDDLL